LLDSKLDTREANDRYDEKYDKTSGELMEESILEQAERMNEQEEAMDEMRRDIFRLK